LKHSWRTILLLVACASLVREGFPTLFELHFDWHSFCSLPCFLVPFDCPPLLRKEPLLSTCQSRTSPSTCRPPCTSSASPPTACSIFSSFLKHHNSTSPPVSSGSRFQTFRTELFGQIHFSPICNYTSSSRTKPDAIVFTLPGDRSARRLCFLPLSLLSLGLFLSRKSGLCFDSPLLVCELFLLSLRCCHSGSFPCPLQFPFVGKMGCFPAFHYNTGFPVVLSCFDRLFFQTVFLQPVLPDCIFFVDLLQTVS